MSLEFNRGLPGMDVGYLAMREGVGFKAGIVETVSTNKRVSEKCELTSLAACQ